MADQQWTDVELTAAARAYLDMLAEELAGVRPKKTARRRELLAGPLATRSESSIEFRMQNISAVLASRGEPWIEGYRPADHVGAGTSERLSTIIGAIKASNTRILTVSDIVGDLSRLAGVKAVFGTLKSYALCFGGRGDPKNVTSFNSVAAGLAKRVAAQPFVVTIGGGDNVRDGLDGRVLDLARVSAIYGPTKVLVTDPAEAERLTQWPVAIALYDVWRFVGSPHLVSDLGLPDKRILAGAMDGVVRPAERIEAFWDAVKSLAVEPVPLPSPQNFYDEGRPKLVGDRLPRLSRSAREEGERIWKLQRRRERDRRLAAEAKALNYQRQGAFTCEACEFASENAGMFDAHHPSPLAIGPRTTYAEHLEVLCPTCHRKAHLTGDRLVPLTLAQLKHWIAEGRAS